MLAGILIKVGTDIIDWDYLRRIPRTSRTGVVIMLTVLLATIFVDLITAVAIGMVAASLVFLKRHTDLQIESIRLIDGESGVGTLSEEERTLFDRARARYCCFSPAVQSVSVRPRTSGACCPRTSGFE